MGDERQEIGDWRQETEDERWETGCRRRVAEDGRWEVGDVVRGNKWSP